MPHEFENRSGAMIQKKDAVSLKEMFDMPKEKNPIDNKQQGEE